MLPADFEIFHLTFFESGEVNYGIRTLCKDILILGISLPALVSTSPDFYTINYPERPIAQGCQTFDREVIFMLPELVLSANYLTDDEDKFIVQQNISIMFHKYSYFGRIKACFMLNSIYKFTDKCFIEPMHNQILIKMWCMKLVHVCASHIIQRR